MIVSTLLLEDTHVLGQYLVNQETGEVTWDVQIVSTVSGKNARINLTTEEWCAVMALAFDAESYPGYLSHTLYEIAERAMAKLPEDCRDDCRIIP